MRRAGDLRADPVRVLYVNYFNKVRDIRKVDLMTKALMMKTLADLYSMRTFLIATLATLFSMWLLFDSDLDQAFLGVACSGVLLLVLETLKSVLGKGLILIDGAKAGSVFYMTTTLVLFIIPHYLHAERYDMVAACGVFAVAGVYLFFILVELQWEMVQNATPKND